MNFTSFFDKMFWLLLGAIPFLIGLIYKMGNQLIKSEFKEEIKKLENKLNDVENILNSLKRHEKINKEHSDILLAKIYEQLTKKND
jgi:chaperonin cofactor prefoldin